MYQVFQNIYMSRYYVKSYEFIVNIEDAPISDLFTYD